MCRESVTVQGPGVNGVLWTGELVVLYVNSCLKDRITFEWILFLTLLPKSSKLIKVINNNIKLINIKSSSRGLCQEKDLWIYEILRCIIKIKIDCSMITLFFWISFILSIKIPCSESTWISLTVCKTLSPWFMSTHRMPGLYLLIFTNY